MVSVGVMQPLMLAVFAEGTGRVVWQSLALVGSASLAAREAALASICTTCPTADRMRTCRQASHARHVSAVCDFVWERIASGWV